MLSNCWPIGIFYQHTTKCYHQCALLVSNGNVRLRFNPLAGLIMLGLHRCPDLDASDRLITDLSVLKIAYKVVSDDLP